MFVVRIYLLTGQAGSQVEEDKKSVAQHFIDFPNEYIECLTKITAGNDSTIVNKRRTIFNI